MNSLQREVRLSGFSIPLTLLLYVAVCAASYLKGDFTTNDFERFHDLRLTVLFFVLFLALIGMYLQLIRQRQVPALQTVALGVAVFAVPLLCSFPVGSRDVFGYAFYGKMWGAYGVDPYLHAPATLSHDPWFLYLQAWWKGGAGGYGPVFFLQTRLLYLLSGDHLAAAVAAYKLFDLVLLVGSIWLLARLSEEVVRGEPSRSEGEGFKGELRFSERERWMRATALWAWSPLVLFESLSSAHNELAMAVLLLAAVMLWVRGRWLGAQVFLALSFWYKWYSAVLVPVWIFWWVKRWGWRKTAAHLGVGIAVFAALAALLLLPFGPAVPTILGRPFDVKVASLLFPDEMPPPLWVLFRAFAMSGAVSFQTGRALFDAARLVLFFGGLGWLIWRRIGAPYRPGLLVEDLCWSLLLVFGFVVTVLWPWHLLPVCALALARCRERFVQGVGLITAAALLSYFLTFMWAFVLCALIVAALGWMRRPRRLAAP